MLALLMIWVMFCIRTSVSWGLTIRISNIILFVTERNVYWVILFCCSHGSVLNAALDPRWTLKSYLEKILMWDKYRLVSSISATD